MVRRLSGLPNVVFHLTFSPDGAKLAAALGVGGGIRVFGTTDGTEVGRDTDYDAESYGLDFDRAGRLVTSCYDGYLRLYDRSLKLVKKVRAPGGGRPYAVRFAPDGAKVAVYYAGSTRVDVLDGGTLAHLYQPDTSGVGNGGLNSVAWSADGAALYAGGTLQDGTGTKLICRWAEAGRGQHQDLAAASRAIFDLAPLPAGGVVLGTSGPAWGVFSTRGERTRLVAGEIADYRGLLEGFRTDVAGDVVRFAYEQEGKAPARFSLPERRLEMEAGAALQPPRTDGLAVTDWKDNYAPKLGGAKLELDQYEFSRSLAIAPDAQRFLLGTEYALRLFDRNGKQQWEAATPSTAWSVNLSGNGKLALAAFGDGTIRWYGLTDGQELLAFFPHNDRERWVLWTPSGYYDASPGAEDLIGWHVNNGKEREADFFPASQFRNLYYRPDVISRVLQTLDEAEAVRLADAEAGRKRQELDLLKRLPPLVQLIAPHNGMEVRRTELTVYFTVRAPSGEPVTGIKALVDGRPVEIEKDLQWLADTPQHLQVTLPEQDCELQLLAENRFATSVPEVRRLKWRGRVAPLIKPNLYLLAAGVSRYANSDYNLGFAAKDARDFAAAMTQQQGLLYGKVEARLLADGDATRDEIVDGLDWIWKQAKSSDVAMVFLAGHGDNDSLGRYFFWPHNIEKDRLLRTGVSFSDIKSAVEAIAGKAVFFVDTCHSGNALGGKTRAVDINGFINELTSAENGAVVFAASTGKQVSLESKQWNNGAFTKALVEGIDGGAVVQGKSKITITSLDLYLSERVKELTRGKQTPTTTKPVTVPDFPIAVKQ
jgi:WD40 repeat protein